jgi:hypothetical protein
LISRKKHRFVSLAGIFYTTQIYRQCNEKTKLEKNKMVGKKKWQ